MFIRSQNLGKSSWSMKNKTRQDASWRPREREGEGESERESERETPPCPSDQPAVTLQPSLTHGFSSDVMADMSGRTHTRAHGSLQLAAHSASLKQRRSHAGHDTEASRHVLGWLTGRRGFGRWQALNTRGERKARRPNKKRTANRRVNVGERQLWQGRGGGWGGRSKWKKGKRKESDRCQSRTGVAADLHATTHLRPRSSAANVCWYLMLCSKGKVLERGSYTCHWLVIQWNRKTGVLKCTFKTQVPVGCSHVSTQLSQLSKMPLASTSIVVSSQVDPNRSKSVVDNADKTLWVYWPWVEWLLLGNCGGWKGPEHHPLVGGISSIAVLKKGVSSLKHFAKKSTFLLMSWIWLSILCMRTSANYFMKLGQSEWRCQWYWCHSGACCQCPGARQSSGLCSTVSSLCASLQKTLITAVVIVILPAFLYGKYVPPQHYDIFRYFTV